MRLFALWCILRLATEAYPRGRRGQVANLLDRCMPVLEFESRRLRHLTHVSRTPKRRFFFCNVRLVLKILRFFAIGPHLY